MAHCRAHLLGMCCCSGFMPADEASETVVSSGILGSVKKIKIDHELAQRIRSGSAKKVWQIFDKQDLRVNDIVVFIDASIPNDTSHAASTGPFVITLIVEKRLGRIEDGDYYNGGPHGSKHQLVRMLKRKYYGSQIDDHTPIKIVYFEDVALQAQRQTPTSKVKSHVNVDTATIVKEAKLYADGGSRGNPGPSASGYVIMTTDGKILIQKGIYLGVTTNNQAEYQALKFGLEDAIDAGITTIHVYMDSLLVINQMLGKFNVKNRDLWPIHDTIVKLLQRFYRVSFTHVPRELNKAADHAVNEALDEAERGNS